MNPAHRQFDYTVRFDWGLSGASAIGSGAGIAVVVDVLSFTTTLSVAADRGVSVLPFRWNDSTAAEFAVAQNATLAVGRRAAQPGAVSLSPQTVRAADGLQRLVLPSPNGSTIAYALSSESDVCIGASLRNARAVAQWIADNRTDGGTVAVIAAGERWPDGSLRPAAEDLWGAGAVIAGLVDAQPELSIAPEAEMAAAAWYSVADRIGSSLRACASGRELIGGGFPADVSIAGEVDESTSVPVLAGNRFGSPEAPPTIR